jgi:hypothetical protein
MNGPASITVTPVRVADLLAEGERMPVYVHVIDHPDARVLVDRHNGAAPGPHPRHSGGRRRDWRASGRRRWRRAAALGRAEPAVRISTPVRYAFTQTRWASGITSFLARVTSLWKMGIARGLPFSHGASDEASRLG